MDTLLQIPLFEGVSDDEMTWMLAHSHEETLENGAYFYRENEPAGRFYIVLEGELQVSRTVNGSEVIMGTTPRGVMGGEIALLNRSPSQITARAIMPCRLMVFEEDDFRALFAACPTVGMRILETTAERMQGTVEIVKQREKMAALGKLSAGLAHELNNPAAAARRASQALRDTLPTLQTHALTLSRLGLSDSQTAQLDAFQQTIAEHADRADALSPLEQSSREDDLSVWLDNQGVADGWSLAETFVSAGLAAEDFAPLVDQFPSDALAAVLAWLHSTLEAVSLLDTIEQSTQRIADLVAAIKSYTYRDQAPVQDVDIRQGLENTLTVLRHKLGDVHVVRQYDSALPRINARGGELNQVWTNLIDNAIDAMHGQGTLTIITRAEAEFIMVEIADTGPGIPPDVLPRLFEPFFTTKPLGSGTGLGLDISYRIIQQHQGTIEVRSEPGHTRFIVRLPLQSGPPSE